MDNINEEDPTPEEDETPDVTLSLDDEIQDDVQLEVPLDGDYTAASPPPPADPQAATGRLTRDPFATFGGVLSGIAHRYGWEVSLTRLAFVVLLIISAGTAFIAYLLSWLIIPRATVWPPSRNTPRSGGGLKGRDLGIGLVGVGALVVLGVGSGNAAAVLVPLALVGAGIWLLVQNPRAEIAGPGGAAFSSSNQTYMASPASSVIAAPVAPPAPVEQVAVPKRSKLRTLALLSIIGLFGLVLVTVIAAPIALFAVFGGDFEGSNIDLTPVTIEEIPGAIIENAGEVRLDLREIDFSSVDSADPVDVRIDVDFGQITVLLPDEVRVRADAESNVGSIQFPGRSEDGFSPDLSLRDEDPQLILDLDLRAGEIIVRRGDQNVASIIEID